ncbi:MAG TPA: DUF503 domain-containing protein [Clostridiaceae bacterium]|nr:DUF503 domain-containing protein [Clostridiaceae bacterium]
MQHRILIIEAEIKLFDSHSLKEKRILRQKLTEKLRSGHNVSIAETDKQDLWDFIALTIAYVAIDQSAAEKKAEVLEKRICEILEQDGSGELIRFYREVI